MKVILSVSDEGYSSVSDEGYSSVSDEGYSSVSDEGYSRNTSCALNYISWFLLFVHSQENCKFANYIKTMMHIFFDFSSLIHYWGR
jgi:hypothetical protein